MGIAIAIAVINIAIAIAVAVAVAVTVTVAITVAIGGQLTTIHQNKSLTLFFGLIHRHIRVVD